MRIIFMLAVFVVSQTICIDSIFAAGDNPAANKQPLVSILPSDYISFTNTNLVTSNGAMVFEGNFIILGEGIYGHFDMTVYADSGKVIQKIQSDDRAWRRVLGSRVKSISMSIGPVAGCSKIEVSFHEMRLELGTPTGILDTDIPTTDY